MGEYLGRCSACPGEHGSWLRHGLVHGGQRWQVWNWRVIIGLLQVRGRNIRSVEDVGVTFLISQQFRRFAYGSLPEWLKPAYVGGKTFEECVKETVKMLS